MTVLTTGSAASRSSVMEAQQVHVVRYRNHQLSHNRAIARLIPGPTVYT